MNPLDEKTPAQVEELQQQWIDGNLYPWIRKKGGLGSEAVLDRRFGAWLTGRELAQFEHWHENAVDVRRWCWSPNWKLIAENEELYLASDEFVPTLLEEVDAGCPKAELALAIVKQHMRDSAHESLKGDAMERLSEMAAWLPLLEPLADRHDMVYPLRLLSYREPRKVLLEEARWRFYDFRSGGPDYENLPVIRRWDGCWVCPHGDMNDEMTIETETGIMKLTASYQRT